MTDAVPSTDAELQVQQYLPGKDRMKDSYARMIIRDFPFPIAAPYKKLKCDEFLEPGALRLKQLLTTGEAITRFLGVLGLCAVRATIERGEGVDPPHLALSADFGQRFKRISWGTWLHLGRECQRWLIDVDEAHFMPELADFFFKRPARPSAAQEALNQLVSLRNGLSHERLQAMYTHEFQQYCDEAESCLDPALEALAFLAHYELQFVREIGVNKPRRQTPVFDHKLKLLIGESDKFDGARETYSEPLDCQAVVLWHRDGKRFLNLEPLLVYEEGAGKAADLFFYNGMDRPERAEYVACNHGGRFTLDARSAPALAPKRAEELTAELAHLIGMFEMNAAVN